VQYQDTTDTWQNLSVGGDTGMVYLKTYSRNTSFTEFIYNVGRVSTSNVHTYTEFLTDTLTAPQNAATRGITSTSSYRFKRLLPGENIVVSTTGGGYSGKIRIRIDYAIF